MSTGLVATIVATKSAARIYAERPAPAGRDALPRGAQAPPIKMKKPIFDKVCVVGVGLIGGSIALAMTKRGLAKEVIGVSRHSATLAKAKHKKVIRRGFLERDMRIAVAEADLIILAGPIPAILEHIRIVGRFAKSNALIIDVGSTKYEIQLAGAKYIDRLMKRLVKKAKAPSFVGCHPMAGSDKSGVENARPDLFEKSICFITREDADPRVAELWRSLGSKPISVSPVFHDAIVARISHLPHVLSFALFQDFPVNQVPVLNPSARDYANLSRLSRSDAALWADVLLSNRLVLAGVISAFQNKLEKWKQALRQQDKKKLQTYIRQANRRSYA